MTRLSGFLASHSPIGSETIFPEPSKVCSALTQPSPVKGLLEWSPEEKVRFSPVMVLNQFSNA